MAYHESFWVVVGTVAPVFAIAATLLGTKANSVPVPAAKTLRDFEVKDPKLLRSSKILRRVVLVTGLIVSLQYALDATMLFTALQSLAADKDKAPTGGVIWFASAAIAVLLVMMYTEAFLNGFVGKHRPALERWREIRRQQWDE